MINVAPFEWLVHLEVENPIINLVSKTNYNLMNEM